MPKSQGLISTREMSLIESALEDDGWFRIKALAERANESRDWVNALAQRWEHMGYLTAVQRNEKGYPQGRRLTETLLDTAGLGGRGDLADQAELAELGISSVKESVA